METKLKPIFQEEFKALGTDVSIDLVLEEEADQKKAELSLLAIKELIKREEKVFSRFDEESVLGKLNQNLNKWHKVPIDLLFIAKKALLYFKQSERLYDVRVLDILEEIGYLKNFHTTDFTKIKKPKDFVFKKEALEKDLQIQKDEILFKCKMDFSGIVKGYIADKVGFFLKKQGFLNFIVDLGGDLFVSGKNREDKNWIIGIEGVPEEKLLLDLKNASIATSGVTRRNWSVAGKKFHHLVNPLAPENFSFDLSSISVIEKSSLEADFMAKFLFLLGEKKGQEFSRKNKIKSFFLFPDGRIWISPEGKKCLI